MNREAIDTWIERVILALVLGAIVFATLAFGGVRPRDFVVVWWLLLGGVALWLVRIWLAPQFRFLWPPLCWSIVPFVAYAIWRYRTADIEFLARQELIQILLAALLLLLIVNNLYSQESTRLLSLSLVFLGMGIAMYGVFQWLRSTDTVWGLPRPSSYQGRASGSFVCPNHLAGFLEMVLPLGITLAVIGRVPPVTRVLLLYATLVMLAGLAGTHSRAAWIAAAGALLFLLVFMLRTRGQRWIALTLAVALGGSGYWFYTRTAAVRVQSMEVTGHGREIRLRLWSSALQLWHENPLWGIGADHFDYRYPQKREAADRTQGRPGRVHNDYLNTLVDYGAVGLLLALIPLGVAGWTVKRCWPHVQRAGSDFGQKRSNRAAMVLGAASGLVALLVHSFFDFNMHVPSNAYLAVTLLGIIGAHTRFATERYWVTARWPVAAPATLVLAAALACLGPQAVARSRQANLLRLADQLEDGAPRKIALMERAARIDPQDFETAFAVGEQYRALAVAGVEDHAARAETAARWFERVIASNRWHVNARLHLGMCLDWLGRHDEAAPHFTKALELDPNHWYARGMMGWHYFQIENYDEAIHWMLQSRRVNWTRNPLLGYLPILDRLQKERQAGKPPRFPGLPPR